VVEKCIKPTNINGRITKEIFSTEFKNKLKILYDRDWKRKKE